MTWNEKDKIKTNILIEEVFKLSGMRLENKQLENEFKSHVGDLFYQKYNEGLANINNAILIEEIKNKLGQWHHEQAILHYPHAPRFRYANNQVNRLAIQAITESTRKAKL
ncbi:MAG: hypothetical protein A3E82_03620 [Gammaproteobacteria bacterium RIFCSPHIGHO2_12_FULL_38_11]|nr:MAG: hypothetical protein A3E82_03620 [Gammaproteobacteria bacterium RIFCSPHIGHO2_12_FULL_38_11]